MTTIAPAPQELADLVAAMRSDWDRAQIDGAIAAARNAGWTFTRTARETIRLACDPASSPGDVAAAVSNPLHRNPGVADPSDIPEWAQARQALAERTPPADAEAEDGAA